MARIKVKQMDDRVATAGIHLGGDLRRRKLYPGEVVEIPEDFMADNGKHTLLETVMVTGKAELTLDDPTRPLDFASEKEAKMTSPDYKVRDPNEHDVIAAMWADIAERLAAGAADPVAEPADETPDEEPAPRQTRRKARRQTGGSATRQRARRGTTEATA